MKGDNIMRVLVKEKEAKKIKEEEKPDVPPIIGKVVVKNDGHNDN